MMLEVLWPATEPATLDELSAELRQIEEISHTLRLRTQRLLALLYQRPKAGDQEQAGKSA